MTIKRSTSPNSPPVTAQTQPSGSGSTSDAYPAVPQTSAERLAAEPADPQGADGVADVDRDGQARPNTVLYLAYGSNMAAKTFLGMRGIRPLSQVNVSVPTLRLTMDLPGIAYQEPRFANVEFQKLPEKPVFPAPPIPAPEWDGGLMGVVYEVTQTDYRQIMRTEGGGSAYQEIFVPCVPLPPGVEIPERPPFDRLPRPFIARTLYSPSIPEKDPPAKRSWWRRLFSHSNRSGIDGQASERYLNLLRDGAREHELPEVYQDYLNAMQPYRITSWRQRVGQILLLGTGMPIFMTISTIGKWFADENGKYPLPISIALTFFFNIVWLSYDCVIKPLFGDGERTMKSKKVAAGVAAERRPLLANPV